MIILKNDKKGMQLLSQDVVECLESIDSFSIDGKYINPNIIEGRMSNNQVTEFKKCYFGLFIKKHIKWWSTRKIIKELKPLHSFIVSIYRNGTPSYRFESKRVDDKVTDKYILKQFALAFKMKIKEML